MNNHYYNEEDLKKNGEIGALENALAHHFWVWYGGVFSFSRNYIKGAYNVENPNLYF